MIKLVGLSDEQVKEISHRIADAFFDYEYNKEDIGLIKYITTRDDMFTYMNAIVCAAAERGCRESGCAGSSGKKKGITGIGEEEG